MQGSAQFRPPAISHLPFAEKKKKKKKIVSVFLTVLPQSGFRSRLDYPPLFREMLNHNPLHPSPPPPVSPEMTFFSAE